MLFLLVAGTGLGADYYVDGGAPGGGNGSLSTPWNAISSISGLGTGDNLYFARGSILTGQLTVAWSGTASNAQSVIGAYGTGDRPIIDGSSGLYCVQMQNSTRNNIRVQDLHLRNPSNSCLRIRSTNSWWTATNLLIEGSKTAHGITLDALHVRILNCLVRSNGSTGGDHGIYVDTTGVAEDIVIDGTTFTANSGSGIKINSGNLARIRGVVVRNCLISSNGNHGIDDYAADAGAFFNNILEANGRISDGHAIYMASNVGTFHARSNLIAANLLIHSRPGYAAIKAAAGSTGHLVQNNIFADSGTAHYLEGTDSTAFRGSDHNLFFGGSVAWVLAGTNYASIANWQAGSGFDGSSLVQDPLLTDYVPAATSPAVNAGTDLSAWFSNDRLGVLRSAPWDIGPFEYVAPEGGSGPNASATAAWADVLVAP
mgnify:CR=1 FL=1